MAQKKTVDDYISNAKQWNDRLPRLRQWRMTSAKDIKPAVIKRYVERAKAV